jgi:hypothetical protein
MNAYPSESPNSPNARSIKRQINQTPDQSRARSIKSQINQEPDRRCAGDNIPGQIYLEFMGQPIDPALEALLRKSRSKTAHDHKQGNAY